MNEVHRVVVVNWGTKYPPEYTHRIYNMVKRNTTRPFEFYVLTDQVHLYPDYKTIDISKYKLTSWWTKLLLFRDDVLPTGEYLYLDLDVVLVDNIDCFFDHPSFGISRDFIRPDNGITGGKEYNSSVMRFTSNPQLWKFFNNNKDKWLNLQKEIHFVGDQNVISEWLNLCKYKNPFPDEWCSSFKKGSERGKHAGDRSEWFGRQPTLGTKIVVFHGSPNPMDILSNPEQFLSMGDKFCTPETITWIRENWC